MDRLATQRCHRCCGQKTHIFKKGYEILEHTIEFTFKSHEL